VWVVLGLTVAVPAQDERKWTVEGIERDALLVVPRDAKDKSVPLVFDFHGHGGTSRFTYRRHKIHEAMPEAIVVYPQGLPSKTKIDPEGKRPGWQLNSGLLGGDRDLKFFDAMLESLSKDYKVDPQRVYSTGHSNGAAFSYLLWADRREKLAAVAPVAAGNWPLVIARLQPLPCLHIAGKNDPIVKFSGQKLAMDAVQKINQTATEGKVWDERGTLYAGGAGGADLVTVIHDGGHEYPTYAAEMIAKFFREHKREKTAPPASP